MTSGEKPPSALTAAAQKMSFLLQFKNSKGNGDGPSSPHAQGIQICSPRIKQDSQEKGEVLE